MKKIFLVVALLVLSGCNRSVNPVSANIQGWTSLNHNLPARLVVDAVAVSAIDPEHVFIGVYGLNGVYSSRRVFDVWAHDFTGLPQAPMFALLPAKDKLYGGSAAGVFRKDYSVRGAPDLPDWELVKPIPQVAVYALAEDEAGAVYAATDGRGIWKSEADAGWSRVNGLDDEPLTRLLVQDNGQTLFAGTGGHGLFVTRDGGVNWKSLDEFKGEYINAIVSDPRDAQVLYVAPRGGVYRSHDDGETWTALNGGIEREVVHTVLVHPLRKVIFAGTNARGMWESEDEGDTWEQTTNPDGKNPFPMRRAILTMVPEGNFIYVGTEDGLMRSSDIGHSWVNLMNGRPGSFGESVNERLGEPNINAIGYSEPFGLAIAAQQGLFRLPPSGSRREDYTQVVLPTTDAPVTAVAFAPSEAQRMYVGTDGTGVFVSDDAGATWNAATGELGGKGRIAELMVDPTNPEIVFARVLFERIYKSTDGGDSWRAVWTGMPVEEQIQSMAIAPGDPKKLYAGGDTQFFASEDGGETWESRGMRGISTLALWAHPDNADVVWAGATDGFYISRDAGKTWKGPMLEGISVSAIARDPNGRMYLGTHYKGVYTADALGERIARFATGEYSDRNTRALRGGVKELLLKPSEGRILAVAETGLECTMYDPAFYTRMDSRNPC